MENNHNNQIVKPKVWHMRDTYLHFVEQLLKDNPEYWTKYSKTCRMRNFWVYMKSGNKVIEVINFERWKSIMYAYFMSARKYIIQGEALSMGSNLGLILPKRVERNHKNKQVNWGETRKRPKVLNKDGKLVPDVIVYFTDDEWLRIAWRRTKKLTNETVYKFTPCQSSDNKTIGFQEQFSMANQANPALRFNYLYVPYVKLKKNK